MSRIFNFLKNIIIWMIHHPRVTAGIGVLLLVSLIWGIGNIAKETRLFATMGVVGVWTVLVMLDQWRTQNGAKQLEASLKEQSLSQMGKTRPDRKEEIDAIREQFDQAVASLKQSKLGKGGAAALYALPWYMIIGPPGSGKSTALEHSGLQFPQMGSGKMKVRGIGGTRNCDWWFTSEAVLLDTAGRYVTEEDDREEWLSFLDMLKKHRKSKPINGVMAAISLPDLLQADEEALVQHAKNIRDRVDELISRLGTIFPVYLVFTKCDLVSGFTESFEDLNVSEREEIFGCTLPRNLTQSAKEAFDQEWNTLLDALKGRRLSRLATACGLPKVKEVYTFPLQLSAGQERLSHFVEILFQKNPYQENAIFRGFYLTSGTQEGTPIDRILSRVSRDIGLPNQTAHFDSAKEPKSYFIKKALTDVMFPDQLISNPSSAHIKQRGALRIFVFIGAVLTLVLAIAGGSFSFIGNNHLIGSVEKASLRALEMNPQESKDFVENIKRLDRLSKRLNSLMAYEKDGVPFRLKGGLYQGDRMIDPALAVYLQQFSKLFSSPTQRKIEGTLLASSAKNDGRKDYFSTLKAYLMLTGMSKPDQVDPAFLKMEMDRVWNQLLISHYGGAATKELEKMIQDQIAFYTSLLNQPETSLPLFSADPALVNQVRQVLRQISMEVWIYRQIREEGSKMTPFTITTALQGEGESLLMTGYAVPGFFTAAGWEGEGGFTQILEKAMQRSGDAQWVLGLPARGGDKMRADIERLYFNDYIGHWLQFLSSLRLKNANTLQEIATVIPLLSNEQSVTIRLLQAVDRNTNIGGNALLEQGGGLFEQGINRVKKGIGIGSPDAANVQPVSGNKNPVAMRFRTLHTFISSADLSKEPPLTTYIGELRKVNEIVLQLSESEAPNRDARAMAQQIATGQESHLKKAGRSVEYLLLAFDAGLQQSLTPFLMQPFDIAENAVMGGALVDLNRLWASEVFPVCSGGLGGRYPFKRAKEEAALADVGAFFYPHEGILWKFVERDMAPFLEQTQDKWEVKRGVPFSFSADFLKSLHHAQAISDRFFSRDSADVKVAFDLYPYPRRGVEEFRIQIDGAGIRYRNEPQEWHPFRWPGEVSSGASFEVIAGGKRISKEYPGAWGLFRFLEEGQATRLSNTDYKIEWNLPHQIQTRVDIKSKSYKNPFQPGLFSDFKCVERVG
jgi:type VI secretion system protein ImpL